MDNILLIYYLVLKVKLPGLLKNHFCLFLKIVYAVTVVPVLSPSLHLTQIPACRIRCCGCNIQIHTDYRNPVEKKGWHGHSPSERGLEG